MGLLVGGSVRPGGEGAVAVAAVGGGGLPVAGSSPSLDQLGLECR